MHASWNDEDTTEPLKGIQVSTDVRRHNKRMRSSNGIHDMLLFVTELLRI